MGTFLFHDVIFGPIHSRRLGLSLGVNLLPTENKLCNFNCIYCECGWNTKGIKPHFNSREDVHTLLGAKLTELSAAGVHPDVITFAGNGEPTMHPDFEAIMDDTIVLRDALCPLAKISVLSNATMLHRPDVCRALRRVDNNILKLDSAFDRTIELINGPNSGAHVARTVQQMQQFEGRLTIQTMFLRGEHLGQQVDNTTPEEVKSWLALVEQIAPRDVMIYTIDRDTPEKALHKIPLDELNAIAEQVRSLGIACSVAG